MFCDWFWGVLDKLRLRKRTPIDDCGFEADRDRPRCASSLHYLPRSSSEFAAQDFLQNHTPQHAEVHNLAPRAVSVSTIPSCSGSSTVGLLPPLPMDRHNGFSTPVKAFEGRRAVHVTPTCRVRSNHVTSEGRRMSSTDSPENYAYPKKASASVNPIRTRHQERHDRDPSTELSGYLFPNGTGFSERIVDGPPAPGSGSSSRVRALEERIRELEATVQRQNSSKREHRKERDSAAVLSSEFAKSIVNKEVELERLRYENGQLRNDNLLYEKRQKDLQNEVARSKKEWASTAEELQRVLAKQSQLEEEYSRISSEMARSNEMTMEELDRSLQEKNNTIQRLILDAQKLEESRKTEITKLDNSCRFLELQNADLINHTQKQDARIKELQERLEKEKTRSNTEGSSDSGRTRSSRPYTKANSNLGASSTCSSAPIGSTQFVNNLRRSLSNVALDTTRSFELTRTMSQFVRAHYNTTLETRFLAKNLIVVLQEILQGRHPNMTQLLCLQRIDSDSEDSDDKGPVRDSTPMTVGAAENLLRKHDVTVNKLSEDLDAIRKLVTEISAKARQYDGQPGCFLQ